MSNASRSSRHWNGQTGLSGSWTPMTANLDMNLAAPAALSARYRAVRRQTDALCELLTVEDHVIQSMPDASPARWHLAHTTWFFETFVLAAGCPGYVPYHPDFAYLFNSYYNQVGPQYPRPLRGLLSRPGVAAIYAYRHAIDERMQAFLDAADGRAEPLQAAVELGLQHEQQHQELILTDLKHLLSCNPLLPVYRDWPDAAGSISLLPLFWIAGGQGPHAIGHAGAGFAFDNEGPRHTVWLQGHELASRPVSNGEYLGFIEAGGYCRPELWLSLGWDTVKASQWEAPLYWVKTETGWQQFTLAGLKPLELDAPVCHVSLFEAEAYARWACARLPTEAEWEAAAGDYPVRGHFADAGRYQPLPAAGVGGPLRQLFGDVWEWTASPYSPYPGFAPSAGAVGEYNGKFMCNQFVLRGGSCATPAGHVRTTYRNFFPPAARWQFSGFRLAR
jgi:ergothioneine biosynthesis protein EgtB